MIFVHHRSAVFIDPAAGVIESDLLLDAFVVPHQLEHVAGELLAEELDQLLIPNLGQMEIGGSLHVQIGRAGIEFVEDTEIRFAIPGVKLLLDVEDDQIISDIPDEAMGLDLAGGQGAGNLNQIADLNRMPRQQGAAPAGGQSRSRGPSFGPARSRIVDRNLEGCNPIRQDDPMNSVVLIQLADFGFLSE